MGGQTGKDPLAPTRVFVSLSRDVGGNSTLMMKTWTSGKSRGPTSWPSANIKIVSQGRSVVSVANLCRNSTLRNNNPQSWCHWSYWSVLMTMAAVSGDVAHLAQCSMLRAFSDATGRCCRVSVCNVLPRWLPWSLMLPVGRWSTKHNFQPSSYVENQLLFFAMAWKRVTWMILTKNVQYSIWRPNDVKIL